MNMDFVNNSKTMSTFLDESQFVNIKAKEIYYINQEIEKSFRKTFRDPNKLPYL